MSVILADDPLLSVIDWQMLMAAAQLCAHSSTHEPKTLLDVANTYQQLRTRQHMRAEHDVCRRLSKGDWRAP